VGVIFLRGPDWPRAGVPAASGSRLARMATPARKAMPTLIPGPPIVQPGSGASDAARPLDPGVFSPGACVAFRPADGYRETVFLDAGHGGPDPGGVGSTEAGRAVAEAQVNLGVEIDATSLLTGQGYRVVVSRTGPTTVLALGPGDLSGGLLTVRGTHADIAARDVCANLAGADVLVGIYMNAGGWGEAGCVTGYDAARPFSGGNLRLATLLQHDVLHTMNAQGFRIPDGGVHTDGRLGSTLSYAAHSYGHLLLLGPAKARYFSTPSSMPGALIEPLFVSDPFEASIAAGSRGQHLIAAGIAQAINQYFSGS
jgi:N-acetylmuramoyl-L-alanine amidase